MKYPVMPLLLATALAVSGCQKSGTDEAAANDAAAQNALAATAAPAPVDAAAADTNLSAEAPKAPFDVAKLPVSAVKLGAFPYFALPDGYEAEGADTLDMTRFPFWVGDHLEWIEGKLYHATIDTKDGKSYSKYELDKNIESVIAQAGGTRIADAKIPSEELEKIDEGTRQELNSALGDVYNNKAQIYLIHQADKDIWIHYTSNSSGATWSIVEAKPFVASAKIVPPTP